jgi:protein O-GlcNAc transferase
MAKPRAQSAFERGQEWEERGNPTKALGAYREAAAIAPDWPDPHRSLGVLYLEMGRYDEAIAAFRQIEALLPSNDRSVEDLLSTVRKIQAGEIDPAAFAYYVRARDLPDDRLEEQIDLCQKALSLNLTYAAPYAVLGRALLAKGQPNQARTVLERGLTFSPSAYVRAELLFNLGNVQLASGQREEALAAFRQVVALNANPMATRFAGKQLAAAADGRI